MAYVIDQPKCSGCHQCKVACPVGAIRFHNRKYWIDPDKCISCGECVNHCHNAVISNPDVSEKAPVPHEKLYRDYDLVVIGAGGSGLTAAVRAATESGGKLKIAVLEKAARIGGSTWYAHGYRIFYSRLHREAGVPDTRYEDISRFLKETHYDLDAHLVGNVFKASEEHCDWLLDECGCADALVLGKTPWGGVGVELNNPDYNEFPRPDTSIGPGEMGSWIVLKMEQECRARGIDIFTETAARKLLRGDDGAICGVLAEDPGGEIAFSARAAVLAAGCFSHNEKLLNIANPAMFYEGEPVHIFAPPSCTGDGVALAEDAGADIDYENLRALTLGPSHHPYGFSKVCLGREPEIITVDKTGRRYASEEDFMTTNHWANKLPGLVAYCVCDSNVLQTVMERLISTGKDGKNGVNIFKQYREEIAEEAAIGEGTWVADTLEELAEKMGVDVDGFVAEIEKYNQFCRDGADLDHYKPAKFLVPMEKPPFIGMFQKRFQENAMGGCKIDANTRVLDTSGDVIPGLFACGDDTRGVQIAGDVGMEAVERTISALTWCVTSGFISGTEAADYLK